ncbi:unnamed protein product [Closterium sp. Yama58-4]|nr:unnamed protein product [Closterium sp. Yama58-4]
MEARGVSVVVLSAVALAGLLALLLFTDYPASSAARLQDWLSAAPHPASLLPPPQPPAPDDTHGLPSSCHECLACPLYTGSWAPCEDVDGSAQQGGQGTDATSSSSSTEGRDEARYSRASCAMLHPTMDCRVPGRPASMAGYDRYCWRPHACHLPLFDPTDFLDRSASPPTHVPRDPCLASLQARPLSPMSRCSQSSSPLPVLASSPLPFFSHIPPGSPPPLPGCQFQLSWEAGWQGWNGAAYQFLESNTTILHKWSTSLCHMAVNDWSNASQVHAVHLDRPDEFLQAYLPQIDLLVLNTGPHWSRWEVIDYHWRFHVSSQPVSAEQQRKLEANPLLGAYTALRTTIAWILNHGRTGGEGEGGDAAAQLGSDVRSGNKGTHRGAGSDGVRAAGKGALGNEFKEAVEGAGGVEGVGGGACKGGPGGSGARPMVVVLGQPSVHTNGSDAGCHTLPTFLTTREVEQLSFLSRDLFAEAAVADAIAAHAAAVKAEAAAFGDLAADSDPTPRDTPVVIPDYLPDPRTPSPASSMRPHASLPVHLLDITGLTSTRPDAHKSKWHGGDSSSDGEQGDCVHWCLPGVPDAWNNLLYAHVVRTGCFPRTNRG